MLVDLANHEAWFSQTVYASTCTRVTGVCVYIISVAGVQFFVHWVVLLILRVHCRKVSDNICQCAVTDVAVRCGANANCMM